MRIVGIILIICGIIIFINGIISPGINWDVVLGPFLMGFGASLVDQSTDQYHNKKDE